MFSKIKKKITKHIVCVFKKNKKFKCTKYCTYKKNLKIEDVQCIVHFKIYIENEMYNVMYISNIKNKNKKKIK